MSGFILENVKKIQTRKRQRERDLFLIHRVTFEMENNVLRTRE